MMWNLDDSWDCIASQVSSLYILCHEARPEVFDRQSDRVKSVFTYNICKQTRDLIAMLLSTNTQPDGVRLDRLLPGFQSEALDQLRIQYGDHSVEGSPCALISNMATAPAPFWQIRPELAQAIAKMVVLIDRVWQEIEPLRSKQKRRGSSNNGEGTL